jgi:hypothetical protein
MHFKLAYNPPQMILAGLIGEVMRGLVKMDVRLMQRERDRNTPLQP